MSRTLLAVALLALVISAHAELPTYQIANLGTLIPSLGHDGFLGYSEATALNSGGDVVGFSFSSAGYMHAFVHDGTTMRDLGTYTGYGSSKATGINDFGFVVGILETDVTRGFLHDGTTMWELGTLGGTKSTAYGINNGTLVIGSGTTGGDAAEHAVAFVAYQNGGARDDLGTLGGTSSFGRAINDDNCFAGDADLAGDAARHAFIRCYGRWDLGTLGGTNSKATAINISGATVGAADMPGDTVQHAFLYDGPLIGTPIRDLGTLGGDNSLARGINADGLVVGESDVAGGELHAFLYDGTSMRDLNDLVNPDLGFELWSAAAINDAGQIAGSARNLNVGEYRAVLLTPIALSFTRLADGIAGLSAEKKLAKPLAAAEVAYANQDLTRTCDGLSAFTAQVLKLPRKKVSDAQRNDLVGQSQSIMVAVGCP